jgi:hypothetical protein
MLGLQILLLTLTPIFSGVVPGADVGVDVPTLVGAHRPPSAEFLVGVWRFSDHFVRWGLTDKEKARIRNAHAKSFMALRADGSVKMSNLFRPTDGRWEISDKGLVLYDPLHPEFGSQVLVIRKRDENRIWILLPFAGGANAIGMKRAPDSEFVEEEADSVKGGHAGGAASSAYRGQSRPEEADLPALTQEAR